LLNPDEVFFSEQYLDSQKMKNNMNVVIDFVESLKIGG